MKFFFAIIGLLVVICLLYIVVIKHKNKKILSKLSNKTNDNFYFTQCFKKDSFQYLGTPYFKGEIYSKTLKELQSPVGITLVSKKRHLTEEHYRYLENIYSTMLLFLKDISTIKNDIRKILGKDIAIKYFSHPIFKRDMEPSLALQDMRKAVLSHATITIFEEDILSITKEEIQEKSIELHRYFNDILNFTPSLTILAVDKNFISRKDYVANLSPFLTLNFKVRRLLRRYKKKDLTLSEEEVVYLMNSFIPNFYHNEGPYILAKIEHDLLSIRALNKNNEFLWSQFKYLKK